MPHSDMVLLSVKPKWAELILSGVKTIELRKAFPPNLVGHPMYLYATAPNQAVVGRVRIAEVMKLPPALLWQRHGSMSGVTVDEFNAYFDGRQIGVAVRMEEPVAVAPIPLATLRRLDPQMPPFSFRVLSDRNPVAALLLAPTS